jgi:hypothetical protein
MSSELLSKQLTPKDIDLLRKVLADAGYTGGLLPCGTRMNVPGTLLVRLFHDGMRDPRISRQNWSTVLGDKNHW